MNHPTSQSHVDLRRDDSPLIFNESCDNVSSQIDDILHNINTGLILSNDQLLLDDDFLPLPTPQQQVIVNERVTEGGRDESWSEIQIAAASKIQRWFRFKQEQLSKIKLQSLLHNKREQIKANIQEEQTVISEEVYTRILCYT